MNIWDRIVLRSMHYHSWDEYWAHHSSGQSYRDASDGLKFVIVILILPVYALLGFAIKFIFGL